MACLACESDGCNYSKSFPTKISSGQDELLHSRGSIAYLWNISHSI